MRSSYVSTVIGVCFDPARTVSTALYVYFHRARGIFRPCLTVLELCFDELELCFDRARGIF